MTSVTFANSHVYFGARERGITSEVKGDLKGRSVIHWSYYVEIVSAVVQTVIALGYLILNNLGMGIVESVVSGSMYIGAFFLKRFSLAQAMEKSVEDLITENDQLAKQLKAQSKMNLQLKQIREGLSKELKGREDALTTAYESLERFGNKKEQFQDSLDEVSEKLQGEMYQIDQSLQQKIEKLEKDNAEKKNLLDQYIKEKKESLTENQKLLDQYKEATENLSQSIQENAELNKNIDELKAKIDQVLVLM